MFLMAVLLIGLTGESLIIILMQVIGQGFSIAGILGNIYADAATANGISRIGGTLVSANTAGSYISLLLAPAFGVLIAQQKLVYKWLALAAFVFGMVALVLTGSRGAWVATFLSFVILGSYALRKGWLNFKVAGTGIFVSLLIGLIFSGPLYERIFGYDFGSAISRAQQYDVAIQIIKDHPVLGVGVNNYFNALRQYLMWNPDREVFRWVVHNKYLLVWAETGIFGLLFFLMFLGSTIRQGFRAMQFNHPSFSPIALGFAAAITGQMVHMFFDVFHSRPQVQSLWLAAGLVMVLERISRPDE